MISHVHAGTFGKAERVKRFGDGRDWFFERRFGLFLHWGLYAIPGWHEQHQWRGRVPREEYATLAAQWNPTHYDPDAWLDLAETVGMRYVCLTAKHHDGFCLWHSDATDYCTRRTPERVDVVCEFARAFRAAGLAVGFYFSLWDRNCAF